MATTKYLDYAGLQRYHGKLKTDVITPINNRIDEIVNVGGQPNVIEAVKINNNTFAIADKTASLAMNLTYDSTAKKIKLAIGSETQEIDATDFIKDGMLDNATYNAENKKLTLTFNTASGKSAIDVDLTDLVDTYVLSAGAATTGTYLTLTPGVSGTGSTSDPWKVTVALDETNLTTKLTNIKADYINHISNSTEGGPEEAFAIYYQKHRADMPDSVTPVPISGLTTGLTKADTATYETLTRANTGNTFTKVMQKFLANDIDLNTRLASVESTVGGLGSAATKDESYFAKAVHNHYIEDIHVNTKLESDSSNPNVVTTFNATSDKKPVEELYTQLLTNDNVLNTRLTSAEAEIDTLTDQQVAVIDLTAITGSDNIYIGQKDLTSEQDALINGVLNGAITNGTTVVLSTTNQKCILSNIHKDSDSMSIMATFGVDRFADNLAPKYKLVYRTNDLTIEQFNEFTAISNNEIDALFA